MAQYTFYTNPMSRGQIARWALHEADADYEQVLVDWQDKPAALLAANSMGKVPTIVHHVGIGSRGGGSQSIGGQGGGDRVVTEAAAICLYLAQMHPQAGLLPREDEWAAYLRWTFFAAGPIEQVITSKALKFEPAPEQEGMVGFGNAQRAFNALEGWLADRQWVCGDRFTMADVYVGSSVDWGMNFGIVPPRPAFAAYVERIQARPAYRAAKAIDNKLIEEARR